MVTPEGRGFLKNEEVRSSEILDSKDSKKRTSFRVGIGIWFKDVPFVLLALMEIFMIRCRLLCLRERDDGPRIWLGNS